MFSYFGPSVSAKDAVRFLTGDTTENVALLSDDEITYCLTLASNDTRQASIQALQAMLAKVAADTLVSADGMIRDLKLRRDLLQARLTRLEENESAIAALPFAGGLSLSERESNRDDSDLVQPAFRRDQFGFTSSQEFIGTGDNEP